MARRRSSELDAVCPRCGENVILILYKEPATHDDPEQSEIEEYTCDCGSDVIYDDDSAGIKDVLESGEYKLTSKGFLYSYLITSTGPNGSWQTYIGSSMESILLDFSEPSDEIKYFIKGLRPDSFEPFRLWNGTLIEKGK